MAAAESISLRARVPRTGCASSIRPPASSRERPRSTPTASGPFSRPNGRTLAAFTSAGIRTWDVEASPPREYRRAVTWTGNKVRTAFSPDSRRLAAVVLGSVYVFESHARLRAADSLHVGSWAMSPFDPGTATSSPSRRATRCASGPWRPQRRPRVFLWTRARTIWRSARTVRLCNLGESGVVRVMDMATRSQKARFVNDEARVHSLERIGQHGGRVDAEGHRARLERGRREKWRAFRTRSKCCRSIGPARWPP